MNIDEFNIITDHSKNIKLENNTICISRNISCSTCSYDAYFDAMIYNNGDWHCISCWIESGGGPLSENMKTRLDAASIACRNNYLIRNF